VPVILILLFLFQLFLLLFRFSKGSLVNLFRCLVQATILVCVWVYILTEVLSAFGFIQFWSLFVAWLIVNVALFSVLLKTGSFLIRAQALRVKINSPEKRMVVLTAVLLVLPLCFFAVYCPPNNWDSMSYHLPRIEYWIQNQSIAHFPTQNLRQLFLGPFAEYLILHIRMLSGGDQLVNLVQYTGYLLSCALTYLIALELGATSRSRLFAVVLVATLPMAVLQSTTTQTDLIACFFILAFTYFALLALRFDRNHHLYVFYSALALSFSILVKATSYIWAFPICLFVGIHLLLKMRQNIRRSLVSILIYLFCFILILAPFTMRNVREFNDPVGPRQEGFDYRKIGVNENPGIPTTTSNFIKNYLVNFDIFSIAKSGFVNDVAKKVHRVLGLNYYDEGRNFYHMDLKDFRIHEDYSGSFVMAVLLLVGLLCIRIRDIRQNPKLYLYLGCALAAYILFSALTRWQVWGARFQFAFFMLVSIPISILIERKFKNKVLILMLGSLLYAMPFVWLNQRKPVITCAQLDNFSILTHNRESVRYIDKPHLQEQHHLIVSELARKHIKQVGLVFGKDGWEYNLVYLAKTTDPEIQMRYLRFPMFIRSAHSEKADFGYEAIVTKYDDILELYDPAVIDSYNIYGELKLIVFNKTQFRKPI
jgi:hypothetical protein